MADTPPFVSIIVPCYNEQATIGLLLQAIQRQTYPLERLEIVISDGMSSDGTRQEIMAFTQAHPLPQTRIVDNTRRIIPAALNRAIEAARGEIIVRLDAHCVPETDYVARCVAALEQERGDNVGGIWLIRPGGADWIARGIAAAAAHPLGVGDAQYRFTDKAQYVDTVPFGAYRRSLVGRIGPFDESLLTNEDYEFNVRVRQAGGKVWLDPAIRAVYFARPTLAGLLRQYWRYGTWKQRMLRRYPGTLRWRQAIPPFFVLSLLVGLIASLFQSAAGWLLLAGLGVYGLALLAGGIQLAIRRGDPALILSAPLAMAAMHLAWGGAFLVGLWRR